MTCNATPFWGFTFYIMTLSSNFIGIRQRGGVGIQPFWTQYLAQQTGIGETFITVILLFFFLTLIIPDT